MKNKQPFISSNITNQSLYFRPIGVNLGKLCYEVKEVVKPENLTNYKAAIEKLNSMKKSQETMQNFKIEMGFDYFLSIKMGSNKNEMQEFCKNYNTKKQDLENKIKQKIQEKNEAKTNSKAILSSIHIKNFQTKLNNLNDRYQMYQKLEQEFKNPDIVIPNKGCISQTSYDNLKENIERCKNIITKIEKGKTLNSNEINFLLGKQTPCKGNVCNFL